MKKKLFLICDSEAGFSDALAAYLVKKKDLSYTVHACHSPEQVRTMGEHQEIGVLVIGSHFPAGKRKLIRADWIFLLGEEEGEKTSDGVIGIYKYQSAEGILTEMFRYMGESEKKQQLFCRGRRSRQFRIIGICSPVHRTGQTEYAMELGQESALTDAALYLSLELYGGRKSQADGSCLEDLIYYARQENQNLGMLLTTMVRQKGKLDYILPVKVSENLRGVCIQDWRELFSRIAKESVYDVLILDIDPGLPCLYELLKLCTEIHMRTAEDEAAAEKILQFEEELKILGLEELRKKIKKVPS